MPQGLGDILFIFLKRIEKKKTPNNCGLKCQSSSEGKNIYNCKHFYLMLMSTTSIDFVKSNFN